MAHQELLRQYSADPTSKLMYDRDKVLDYILGNGLKVTIDGCIDNLINEAKIEIAEQREQQRIKDEQDARKRDERYANIILYNIKMGNIWAFQHSDRIVQLPEEYLLSPQIVRAGQIFDEKINCNSWTFYNWEKTIQEFPVITIPEADIILTTISCPVSLKEERE